MPCVFMIFDDEVVEAVLYPAFSLLEYSFKFFVVAVAKLLEKKLVI